MLISLTLALGTPDFERREERPCSDRVTGVLAVLMAEEKDAELLKMVLNMQKRQNELIDRFAIMYNQEKFVFVPQFVDRY